MKTGDPKYDIEDGRLINADTRRPIPAGEPLFILRGKDKNAALAIAYYKNLCRDDQHKEAVNKRIHEFVDFAHENPELIREPDTGNK